MKTFAVDFEADYDDEISIKTMGSYNYVRNTDIYMVSIFGEGMSWVGSPEEAPWGDIGGHRWVSHNASFDKTGYDAYNWGGASIVRLI